MINFSFRQKSNPQLFAFVSIMIVRLTDPQFISFKPQATDLAGACTALNTILADAKATSAETETTRRSVIGLLDQLAADMESFAHGNEAIESAAGFDTRKTTMSKVTSVSAPINFLVLNTARSSEVRGSWKPVEGALAYAIEFKLKGETIWHSGNFTTKREILLSGFEPGTYIDFRVCTLGRGELKSDWTPIIGVWIA